MAVARDTSLPRKLEAGAFNALFGWLKSMPMERASDRAAGVARRLGPLTSAHKVAKVNIRLCFPDITAEDERRLLAAMWDNLGRIVGELPHLPDFGVYEDGARIEVEGAERLDAVRDSGRPAVFISGHFSNFEVMAAAIVRRGVPCHVTYRPANNAFIDDKIVAIRSAYGVKLQAAKGVEGGMGLLRALAKGETVAILNDQKYNEGVAAPFFGRPAMTADGPARLARRFKCPLIPLSIRRIGPVRYRVTVHPAIAVDDGPDEESAIAVTVARVNAFMEARVREAPEEWFWVHRRWAKDIYRAN